MRVERSRAVVPAIQQAHGKVAPTVKNRPAAPSRPQELAAADRPRSNGSLKSSTQINSHRCNDHSNPPFAALVAGEKAIARLWKSAAKSAGLDPHAEGAAARS